jgi:apolipoprotein N-acyltransferase
MIALICALLSGAMLYLSQGLNDVWWLAWIAPLPLLWLAYGPGPWWKLFAASLAAFAWGSVYFLQAYGGFLVGFALLAMFGNGALFAGAILLARRVRAGLPSFAALLAFPALWTAAEYLESLVSPHGAWVTFGYTQVAWPAAIQIASLFGAPAITFILCLFANALALALRGEKRAAIAGIAISIAAIGFGYARLAQDGGETVTVAALANISPDYVKAFRTGDPAAALRVTRAYADVIRAQAARGTRIFVTPEAGVEQQALAPLADAARQTGSLVVVGTHGRHPARNMAIALSPDGKVQTYDKRHLLLPGEDAYTPGKRPGLIGAGRAMAICKDLDFPRTIRGDARSGIRLMMVPANDFMKDGWIHARQAILRGVENGFAMVRSAFSGVETVTDAQGRVLASARTDHFGMIVTRATVPLGPGPTLYTRIGDVFAWLCVAAALVLAGLSFLAIPRMPQRTAARSAGWEGPAKCEARPPQDAGPLKKPRAPA